MQAEQAEVVPDRPGRQCHAVAAPHSRGQALWRPRFYVRAHPTWHSHIEYAATQVANSPTAAHDFTLRWTPDSDGACQGAVAVACRQKALAAEHYDGIMGQVLSSNWPVHHVRECLFNHSPSPQVTWQLGAGSGRLTSRRLPMFSGCAW